ncbi:MAG: AmmeMemoRadiSam system radical SAM enzyme [Thermodesulfobacteriota bacterium]
MKEAMFYTPGRGDRVHCHLCAHHCVIDPGGRGKCRVRENRFGVLYSLVYNKAVAVSVDPIEKKPLYHFLPGSRAFSIATMGCNFVCRFCQNCAISQPEETIYGTDMPADEVVDQALRQGCQAITYTYTEPTIYFEYAYDIAILARRAGLANVFVSNGFIAEEPLRVIAPFLNAANIDLKSCNDDFYRKVVGGRLRPVQDAIRSYHAHGIFLEITTLLLPGENDSDEELRSIAAFIVSVNPLIPWHVSRFYPRHQMQDTPVTPAATLERAVRIGREEGLAFVYAGNLPATDLESTFCPHCRHRLIHREGYAIKAMDLDGNRCPACATEIPLVLGLPPG